MKLQILKMALLAAAVVLLVGCEAEKCKINGQVEKEWAGAMVFFKTFDKTLTIDSATVNANGKFSIIREQPQCEVSNVYITKDDSQLNLGYLVLESGTIEAIVLGEDLCVSGTPNNNLLQTLGDTLSQYYEKADKIYALLPTLNDDEQRVAKQKIDAEYAQILSDFARKNYDNVVGAFALTLAYNISDNELEEILNMGEGDFLTFSALEKLKRELEQRKITAVGQQFSDFEMVDTCGNVAHLSDFAGKGNYLIIDFWASWCGPCRQLIPELKEIYSEFQPKGVEIIGVSCDSNKEAWLNAINKLEIPWPQICDLAPRGKSVARQMYGVVAIPYLVLIDPEGKIALRTYEEADLIAYLQKIF